MGIDSNVKREVIEELVRELMVGEKGKEMKENALKWKKLAEKAINSSDGSSYMNFDKRLLKSRGLNSLISLPSFRFESIPDGLPPSNEDATQDVPSLCEACKKSCLAPFKDLVTRLNDNSNFPSISCIVSNAAMSFTQQVSEELGVPNVGFWTSSDCSLWAFTQYPKLVE
ncbi:hypothetical protein RDI58_011544 [Solanum bulbocastanum]|uniref:Uncharacterized protein n=1 Tax=Solanum bulbocastanum TaxID=147425 RepID=A0AAN8YKK3_SOLBU